MGTFEVKLSRLRVMLAKKLNRALLGNMAGGVPSSILGSIEAKLVDPAVTKHVEEVVTFSEAVIEEYDFPEEYPPYFRRSKAFEKRNVYLLRDVCVSPWSGLTWLDNKRILLESVGSLYRITGWGNLLHEPMLRKQEMEVPEYVVCCPNRPFYHWLFEVVPAIIVSLEIKPNARVLVSSSCPNYFIGFIRLMLGPETFAKRVLVADQVTKLPRYIFLQHEQDSGFIHPKSIAYLRKFRDQVLLQTKQQPVTDTPYIYISRKKTISRRLHNEEELEEALQAIGFSVVYSEELTSEQQIATYAQAKCIVASHGAGLSHMVWAKNKVQILEIYAYGHFNDCYARIAMTLGFDHDYVHCEEQEGSFGKIKVAEVVQKLEGYLLQQQSLGEEERLMQEDVPPDRRKGNPA